MSQDSTQWSIYLGLDTLMELPEDSDYLFYNYKWEQIDPYNENRVSLTFSDYCEAAAVYHELWKLRVPKLARSWF